MQALHRRSMIIPNLWTGITEVRPGTGVAIVGGQCAATLQRFIDVGCHSFLLSGYLHDDEAERFGASVLPLVKANNPGRFLKQISYAGRALRAR